MMMSWIIPVHVLSEKRRELLLMGLDMLGKWSLIDTYVLILMLVAFQFHVQTGPLPNTNPPQYGIADVFVQPHIGFYSFLAATAMSLILSHIILALHNYALDKDSWKDSKDERKALWEHAFPADDKPKLAIFKRYLVVIGLLATLGLIGYGAAIFSFAFDFKGAAGWLLILTGQNPKTSYSVVSLGLAIPGAAPPSSLFGVRCIQITFFIFTLAVPLSHLLTVLFLWVTPMKHRTQKRLFVVTEVLNAWSALDVFVVAIIAAVLEIRQFAAFIVGDKCNLINEILAKYFSDDLNGDTKCFDVIATLDTGCWVLFAACILYIIVGNLVMRKCHKTIKDFAKKIQEEEETDTYIFKPSKIN